MKFGGHDDWRQQSFHFHLEVKQDEKGNYVARGEGLEVVAPTQNLAIEQLEAKILAGVTRGEIGQK